MCLILVAFRRVRCRRDPSFNLPFGGALYNDIQMCIINTYGLDRQPAYAASLQDGIACMTRVATTAGRGCLPAAGSMAQQVSRFITDVIIPASKAYKFLVYSLS